MCISVSEVQDEILELLFDLNANDDQIDSPIIFCSGRAGTASTDCKVPGKDLDCGIVVENMALAASSLGLGNVICGMAAMLINDECGAAYKEKLIPEGYEFGVALLVGYPVDTEGTPHEPDMSKIIYVK